MNNNEIKRKLGAIRVGNHAAFEELYNDLKTPIYTIIFRIVWNQATAEDIMQTVFLKLFQSPPESQIKNPRAYIFQIARNLAIDSKRKQHPARSLDEIADTAHVPLDDYSIRMDIEDALKTLPAQECQIVTLHIIGALKFREISEIMKIPFGTVYGRYQKAIRTLQKTISGGTL